MSNFNTPKIMTAKFKYEPLDAQAYQGLGIQGTTFEATFRQAEKLLGDISDQVLLDFGSGTGRSTHFLKELGAAEVIGVDHDPNMVKQAQVSPNSGIQYHLISDTVPLENNSVDGAMCSFVLMEMDNLEQIKNTLAEIARVCKTGAKLVVLVASEQSCYGHEYVSFRYPDKPKKLSSGDLTRVIIKCQYPFEIADHFWTEDDYRICLKQAGFMIKSVSYPKPDKGKWLDETKVPPHLVILATKE